MQQLHEPIEVKGRPVQHEVGEGVGFGGFRRVRRLTAEGDGEIDFLEVEAVIERELELDRGLSRDLKVFVYSFSIWSLNY